MASADEVFDFGDGLAGDPILTFRLADHFAESFFGFAIGGAFDAALGHFLVDHVAEMDLRDAFFREIINGDGFAATAHAEDGDDFEI